MNYCIQNRLKSLKLTSLSKYIHLLNSSEQEWQNLINALTIGETHFFRYDAQFEALQKEKLPKLIKKNKTIRIASLGCATGEEPYTMAMVALECLGLSKCKIEIQAFDINTKFLDFAKKGLYQPYAIRKLPKN